MTKVTNETFLSQQGWRDLVHGAGLTVEGEKLFKFFPEDQQHKTLEDHYLVIARKKSRSNPLFGPHPLLRVNQVRLTRHDAAWKELQHRFAFEDGQNAIIDVLKNDTKILDVGDGLKCV